MFAKNIILQLWSNNLKKTPNAGFFKLSPKNLRYEVKFLDMTRGPRKH